MGNKDDFYAGGGGGGGTWGSLFAGYFCPTITTLMLSRDFYFLASVFNECFLAMKMARRDCALYEGQEIHLTICSFSEFFNNLVNLHCLFVFNSIFRGLNFYLFPSSQGFHTSRSVSAEITYFYSTLCLKHRPTG